MALKDFDDVNPRTRDKNWKEDLPLADMPKKDDWYTYRVLGGVFSYAQHWIEFVNKNGETKRYPVDCANWDPEEEATSKQGGCPCCELGLRPSVRYMMNAIDRSAQGSGQDDPIRTLDLAPTVMRQLVDLKKLNVVKGNPYSVAHKKFGCDIHLMKQASKKRGGVEWQVQKGDRCPLEEEELEYELLDFVEYWLEPDIHKIRADLKRHGYYSDDDDAEEDSENVPSKSSSKKSKSSPSQDMADDVDDDEDDEDFEPPRRKSKKAKKKAAPPPDDDLDDDLDEEEDEDEEEEAPPPRKKKAKKKKKIRRAPPPPADDEDDWEDDDEWDDD